jgi:hypothetical protein
MTEYNPDYHKGYYMTDATGRIWTSSSLEEWSKNKREHQRVAMAEVAGVDKCGCAKAYRVSTVWLGIDHAFGHGRPLLYETMIFAGSIADADFADLYCDRHHTKSQALKAHVAVCDRISGGWVPSYGED